MIDIKSIIHKVSNELNIPEDIVYKTYMYYWKSIKCNIQLLPLKETIAEKDYSKFKTNFNIPVIGKLMCNYDRYKRIKDRFLYIKKIKNNETQ